MSEADTPSAALIATIKAWCEEMGDKVWDSVVALNAKAARSKGCSVSEADAPSAVLAAGDGTAGAPQRPARGAHPFWPGDRAMHGTVLAAVAQRKNPLNQKFLPLTQYARAIRRCRCGKGHSQEGIAGRAGRGCSGGNALWDELGDLLIISALYGASTGFKNAYGGVALNGGE